MIFIDLELWDSDPVSLLIYCPMLCYAGGYIRIFSQQLCLFSRLLDSVSLTNAGGYVSIVFASFVTIVM